MIQDDARLLRDSANPTRIATTATAREHLRARRPANSVDADKRGQRGRCYQDQRQPRGAGQLQGARQQTWAACGGCGHPGLTPERA